MSSSYASFRWAGPQVYESALNGGAFLTSYVSRVAMIGWENSLERKMRWRLRSRNEVLAVSGSYVKGPRESVDVPAFGLPERIDDFCWPIAIAHR
jgi:hypothetical protein